MKRGSSKRGSVTRELPVLSLNETQGLQDQIDELERYIGGGHVSDPENPSALAARDAHGVDLGVHRTKLAQMKAKMAAMSPFNRRISGAKRAAAENRRKQLIEQITPLMLSIAERDAFPSVTDSLKDANYRNAVRHALKGESSELYTRLVSEFRALSLGLNPDDPEFADIEQFRPEGAVSGRHFQGAAA